MNLDQTRGEYSQLERSDANEKSWAKVCHHHEVQGLLTKPLYVYGLMRICRSIRYHHYVESLTQFLTRTEAMCVYLLQLECRLTKNSASHSRHIKNTGMAEYADSRGLYI